jgi:hypothetical protein
MSVMFLVGVAAMLVIAASGTALGLLLLRRGFRPRTTAVLLVSFLPGIFLITTVTSLGSALLPLVWAWALAAHHVARSANAGTTSPAEGAAAEASRR